MTPEEQMFEANIKLLQSIQFEGMDKEARQNLLDSIADIKTDYEDAASKATGDKYYADLKESIAKSLPNIIRGALSAETAFKNGDTLAGAAALMDICASAIPVFTSLFAAAGPEGMVIGAVFSVIGQILTFFEPPKPSLESKIKKMLDEYAAKQKLYQIEGAETTIQEYTDTLRGISKDLRKILAMPLTNEDEADQFYTEMQKVKIEFAEEQAKLINPEYGSWEVAAWLKDTDNYENDLWPEVLGHWCRVYSNLVTANIMLRCLLNPTKVEALRILTKATNPKSPLPAGIRESIHKQVLSLKARAEAAEEIWGFWSRQAFQVVEATRSNAKARGLYVTLDAKGYLWSTTGRKGFQSGWSYIQQGKSYLSDGYANRFSITVAKEEVGSLKPKYHIFVCQGAGPNEPRSYPNLSHAMIDPGPPVSYADLRTASRLEYFADIWALPAPKDQTPRAPKASFVYAAKDDGYTSSVKLFELEPGSEMKIGNWEPGTKSRMSTVRAVTHPPTPLIDDPDKDGLPPGSLLLGGVDHYNSIVYGALRSSPDIFVDQSNKEYYVPSPWPTYSGIAVDDYYLWVFGPEGFACATHASVIKCTLGKSSSPRWISYGIPGQYLFDGYSTGNIGETPIPWETSRDRQQAHAGALPALQGLISFSPCKDGTLVASIYKRTVYHPDQDRYEATDALFPLYTMECSIDVRAGTINVGALVMSQSAAGIQVQKMPVPCWTLFESLKADLQTKKTRLKMSV